MRNNFYSTGFEILSEIKVIFPKQYKIYEFYQIQVKALFLSKNILYLF